MDSYSIARTKNNYAKGIILLLCLMPIVDTVNGIMIRNSSFSVNAGQLYRIALLVMMCIVISSSKRAFSLLIFILSVFLIVQCFVDIDYAVESCVMCIKLFMPIFLIEAGLLLYESKERCWASISLSLNIISIIIPLTIIGPYLMHIGYRTYDGSAGYIGFYNASNEISFAILACIMIKIHQLSREATLPDLVVLGMNLISILLLGTKSGMAIAVCLVIAYLFHPDNKKSVIKKKAVIITGIMLVSIIGIYLFADNLNAIIERLTYIREQHKYESVFYFLTSGRTARIEDAWKSFSDGSLTQLFFGWGLGTIGYKNPNIEMDLFDLLFASGWCGFSVITIIYFKMIKKIIWDYWRSVIFAASFVIMFAGGHVLFSGLGGTMWGLVICYLICDSLTVQNGYILE